jgi:nucleoside-diphosphate-sugar epimerase
LRPASPYGASKAALCAAANQLAQQLGLSTAWARLFFLYGPHEHPRRLVPYVIQSLLAGTPALCTDGKQRRDYLHVSDAAEALIALLDSNLCGPVNIAAGVAPALRELIEIIGEVLGKRQLLRFGALPPRPHDPPIIVADTYRLRAYLGWSPKLSLKAGLEQTIDWWRAESAQRIAA